MTPKQRLWLSAGLFTAIIGGLVLVIVFSPLRPLLTSPEKLRDGVRQFGLLSPAISISLEVMQVIIAPIPGQAIDIANGYLFGWPGVFVSLGGIGLGSTLAIGLARRFGRPLVEVLITPKGLASIRPYVRRRSQLFFFILFLLPGTPDDLLCFAIGLSSIPFGRSVLIALLGRAPGITAAVLFGATGSRLNPLAFTGIAIAVSLLAGWLIWRSPLGEKLQPTKSR